MYTLLRLWRAVEACPWREAVRWEWEERFGIDAAAIRPYLFATGAIDETYPCPNGGGEGCPRQVHLRNGVYEAVCGNLPAECEPVRLEKTQLAVLSLDVQALIAPMVAAIGEHELLEPVALADSDGLLPLGLMARRLGRALIVLATPQGAARRGAIAELRYQAAADAVAILVDDARVDMCTADRLVELAMGDPGNLRLWRALRLLWPESWALRAERREAIFEEVRLEFASEVDRHVVRLNGVELEDFRYSDARLARLLLLAAARHRDLDIEGGGWLKKLPALQLAEKESDLGELRRALVETPDKRVGLTEAELKALLHSSADRPGLLRLGLHPRNIRFDESLGRLRLLGDRFRVGRGGSSAELERNQALVRGKVLRMLAEARRLGAPLPENTALCGP